MKKSLLGALAALVVFGVSVSAFAITDGGVVTSRIPAKIHVVQNFEDWNDVLIRFSGVLRNSCYSKGETKVQVQGDQILIENFIVYSGGQPCLMVITPYSGQVAVRNLNEGVYDVSVMDKSGNYQEMTSFQTE